ncbi:xanthine dehydrogenase family protein subunit M [Candidatus Marsarchaeota archaeon]|nr:xanthine dehydrogenase family protein subunit M [Candidatus Marsarchaeota archaeon]
MLPKSFDYVAPESLEEAIKIISSDPYSRVLAGGQSLIPMMKLRLASPGRLVDISKIKSLSGVSESKESLNIGAMERVAELADSQKVKKMVPALHDAASEIADVQIRSMGTLGGNISNADPSNDMPVVALGCSAKMLIKGKSGEREEPSDSFFLGPYTTKLEQGDILVRIDFPLNGKGSGSAYSRVNRRVGDYALASCCAMLKLDERGLCIGARIAVSGPEKAVRVEKAEKLIMGKTVSKELFARAGKSASESISVEDSYYASAEIKRMAIAHAASEALEKAYARAKSNR